jgi:hypothetical protein
MNWLANLASVNARTTVGLIESVGFVLFVGIMLAIDRRIDLDTLIVLGSFIALHEGLNVTAFGVKRATYTPEVHTVPPREDVEPPKPADGGDVVARSIAVGPVALSASNIHDDPAAVPHEWSSGDPHEGDV